MDTLSLARFDRTLALPSGERLRLRPIRPDDEPRLSELYDRSSRDTRYQRFFTVMRRLPADWARFLANVDYDRRFALVVEDLTAPSTSLIGVARHEPVEAAGNGAQEEPRGAGAAVRADHDQARAAPPGCSHDAVGRHALRQEPARPHPRPAGLGHERVEPALRGGALRAEQRVSDLGRDVG